MTLALAASTDNWELTGTLFWIGVLVVFVGASILLVKAAGASHRAQLEERAQVVRRGIELRDLERARDDA